MHKIFWLLLFFVNQIQAVTLLNSSYDVSREMFAELNSNFIEYWRNQHPKDTVIIRQSHSGSTRQALSVLQGLKADVVTYNQVTDIQLLCDHGNLISKDWQNRLPNNSSPYYSTMAFLVRKGNPKCIFDWFDLLRDDVKLVFPNPKTSGNGRYVYLAAFSIFLDSEGGEYNSTYKHMIKLLNNVEVFDIGGRSSSTTFIERGIGDVLISFESEINSIKIKHISDNFEVIVPKLNILVEFPVTWVDKNVRKNGTEEIAKAYLSYLYSLDAQLIINDFYYRVNKEEIMLNSHHKFPDVKLFRVDDKLGNWHKIMEIHFSQGGELDKLLRAGR